MRASRQWLSLAISVVLLVATLVVMQFIAERNNVRFDLTPSRRLSLSQGSRQILARLEGPVEIDVYYTRGRREENADLLRLFANASPHVRYRLFDIDRYPERAAAAGVRHAERARVTYRGTRTIVSTASEEYLAGGILRVIDRDVRRIYFLRGHGERWLGDPGASNSYWFVARALEAENAQVRPLDLATSGEVPADADAVVIAGPQHDLLPGELAALGDYLGRAGAILALVEPGSLPRLAGFLGRYDVRVGDDIIVDRAGRLLGAQDLAVRVPYYRMHPVTAPTDVPAIMVSARTIDATAQHPDARAQAVARTVESGWATPEIDAARRGEVTYRDGRDRPGPLPVMVAVSVGSEAGNGHGSGEGRLVVAGDADFAADAYIDELGNRDLILNSVSWLTDDTALIARRPREIAEIARPLSPLVLTERQAHGLFILAVIVTPGLVLLFGTAIVAVRRRRG
jgi:ABC-type uncharacterized transport system involved in gliding motility auxiliary subunit